MRITDQIKPTPQRLYGQNGMGGGFGQMEPPPSSEPDVMGQVMRGEMPGVTPLVENPEGFKIPVNFDINRVTPQQYVLAKSIAQQAGTRQSQDAVMNAAAQGIDPDTLNDMNRQQMMADQAAKIARDTAHMADDEYDHYLKQLEAEAMNMPKRPEMPGLEAPNWGQIALAAVAGFIDPKRAAQYASIPLGYQINKRDHDYATAYQRYKDDLDRHGDRVKIFGDITQMRGQRAQLLNAAAQHSQERADLQRSKLVGSAQKLEADLDKIKSGDLPGYLKRIGSLYKSAGYGELGYTDADISRWVQAKQEKEHVDAELKNTEKLRAQIPSLVGQLRQDGVGAARGFAGSLLKGIITNNPRLLQEYGVDPIKLDQMIEELRQPTVEERAKEQRILLDKERTETEDKRQAYIEAQTGVSKEHALKIAKETSWMDRMNAMRVAKGYKEIQALGNLMANRNANTALRVRGLDQEATKMTLGVIGDGLKAFDDQLKELRDHRVELQKKLADTYDPAAKKQLQKQIDDIGVQGKKIAGSRTKFDAEASKALETIVPTAGDGETKGTGSYGNHHKRVQTVILGPTKEKALDNLYQFVEGHGGHITRGVGAALNPGSPHPDGRAVDVRTKDKTREWGDELIRKATAAGYNVVDERDHAAAPGFQRTGPHIHIEIPRDAIGGEAKKPTIGERIKTTVTNALGKGKKTSGGSIEMGGGISVRKVK